MKFISFISIFVFSSCLPLEKAIKESYRSELYIDYKFVSFEGKNSTQNIIFEIDSTYQIKYFGKVIINQNDTIAINGYEKGGFYPSWYKNLQSGERKMMEIWCDVKQAKIPDSLEIIDRDTTNGLIKEKTILYRRPRKKCH